jgi:hypothetical protein
MLLWTVKGGEREQDWPDGQDDTVDLADDVTLVKGRDPSRYDANMRSIRPEFVMVPPAGARVRTRLRLTPADEAVVWAVGVHLGRLAGADLIERCRLDHAWRPGDDQRADRKRALTAEASSRWAGAITRTSNNQWDRAYKNLLEVRTGLRRATNRIRARLDVPVGQARGRGRGRVQGYQTQIERFRKQGRLQHLEASLAEVEERIAQGRVSVCRGGRRLAKLRHALSDGEAAPALTESEWRVRWQAARLFLHADGEAGKPWGNETIRAHPDQQWLEIRLPTPLAHLSNTGGRTPTYRLSCPVVFHHRSEEWAAQAATGAVRYDILLDPAKARWYVDASWRLPSRPVPTLEELRKQRGLGLDLNAQHIACWVLDCCGNPIGAPSTISLALDGLPASTRDGRLRAAVAEVIRLAKAHDCKCITVENLDFVDARQIGRETLGRSRRGKRFRRIVSGMPTRQFRDVLVGMTANADLWVIAVDPGWTSKWGQRYWQEPLNRSTKKTITVTGHHAAAVVIGRRGLGLGARRRPGVTQLHQRMGTGELPARPGDRALGLEGPGPPGGQRATARPHKTRQAERIDNRDQVAQDRPVPPVSALKH